MNKPEMHCAIDVEESLHVMVCERSQTQARLLRRFLEDAGYRVDTVRDPEQAKLALSENHIDIFITGIEIGEVTGLELCWDIKSTPETAHIYTVILTASSDQTRIVESLDAGADDYVVKPFVKAELRARLRAAARIVRMQNSLIELAEKDPLTGAANRRRFMKSLNDEIARHERYNSIFHVLMLDIDHFKSINDTYGHNIGDDALIETVSRLKASVRKQDLVGRLGGEEFAILLPETALDNASMLAERLRQAIADISINLGFEKLNFTVSIGVSGPSENIASADEILTSADECLYKAKRGGRNRVIISEHCHI